MPNILIRDLSEETVAALKKQAEKNERSLNAELRVILDDAAERAAATPVSPSEWLQEVREYRERFKGRDLPDPLDDDHIFEDFERGLNDL